MEITIYIYIFIYLGGDIPASGPYGIRVPCSLDLASANLHFRLVDSGDSQIDYLEFQPESARVLKSTALHTVASGSSSHLSS